MLRVLLTFVVVAGLSSFAYAADKCDGKKSDKSKVAAKGEKKTPEDYFKMLKNGGTGELTLAEFQAPVKKHVTDEAKLAEAMKRSEERFQDMDTDKSGTVSLEEFKAAPRPQHGKHGDKHEHKKADK